MWNAASNPRHRSLDESSRGRSEGSTTVLTALLSALVLVLVPFLGYVWLQTPSGANTCRSKDFGRYVEIACKEEWLRIDDSSANEWFDNTMRQLDQRLIGHRALGEIWDASFMPESAETANDEKAAFERNWATTLHIEPLGVVTRKNPDTNDFTLAFRRYFHSKDAKSSLGYTADRISVEEDVMQVTLRFRDTRVVGTRADRSVNAALDAANQGRLEAIEDTTFYVDPSTAASPGRSIAKGATVWVICAQRAGENEEPAWGRTVTGWVQLSSFKDASRDRRGLGEIYYCATDG